MSRPASASGMDIEGWSGLSVRSKSVSLSQNTRLMTTPSKGTDTAKMLPLEGDSFLFLVLPVRLKK